ncbi:MAG: hypothetical protein HW403_800 [Dehalococcoidia bacterium]|nr:hypothetical protein [Dehalococcoidia bacterium]
MMQIFKITLVCAMALTLYGCAAPRKPAVTPSQSPSQQQVAAYLATTDLSLGSNRFAAALVKDGAMVNEPQARFSFWHLGSGQPVAGDKAEAQLRAEPDSGFALYVAQVSFDRPGPWEVEVAVSGGGTSTIKASARFQVKERSATPGIGEPAPSSRSKKVGDAPSLEELTSASPADPELYAVSIDEAVASGKPTAILFATPAFCTSRTCGPQMEVIQRLKEKFRERANFIHVELFDNPQEVAKDYTKARPSPAVLEWRLPTDPWVFLVDSQGRIAAKFESFTTYEELEPALTKLLVG